MIIRKDPIIEHVDGFVSAFIERLGQEPEWVLQSHGKAEVDKVEADEYDSDDDSTYFLLSGTRDVYF